MNAPASIAAHLALESELPRTSGELLILITKAVTVGYRSGYDDGLSDARGIHEPSSQDAAQLVNDILQASAPRSVSGVPV